jgi:hypothetical protein
MTVDAVRLVGVVTEPDGRPLGEARLWASAERDADGVSTGWRGWLRITDLGVEELTGSVYRFTSVEGWTVTFQPRGRRPMRVFEAELLPVVGEEPAPWPEPEPDTVIRRYRPVWNDAPPRTAEWWGRPSELTPLPLPGPEFDANGPGPRDRF